MRNLAGSEGINKSKLTIIEQLNIIGGNLRNFDFGLTNPVEVSIVDNIMGSGKTTKMIEQVKAEIAARPDEPILIIVPYLDEIRRYLKEINGLAPGFKDEWEHDENGEYIIKAGKKVFKYEAISQLNKVGFKTPINKDGSKTDNLKNLLSGCKNIITTHTLYTRWDECIADLIRSGEYKVIVDEEIECFKSLNLNLGRRERMDLIECDYLSVDEEHKVHWNRNKDEIDGTFSGNKEYKEIRKYALDGDLFIYGNLLKDAKPFIAWSVPKSFYCCAKSYKIMTYRFQASFLAAYFKHHNIPFRFEDRASTSIKDNKELKRLARKLIEIVETPASLIGRGTMYCHKHLNDIDKKEMDKIKKNLTNCLARTHKVAPEKLLLTHSQRFAYYADKTKVDADGNYLKNNRKDKKILTPTKYKDSHLAFSCKGTNDYADRNFVVYLHNVYPNSAIKTYLDDKKVPFDPEEYALSVMLQFIWRSAVRKGETIKLMIPSLRMHRLFTEWLEAEEEILEDVCNYALTGPDGKVVKFSSQTEFCKEHGLDKGHISKVLAGDRKAHKGWKLPAT